jgi:diguanylate cyclase (GGDEF)-like protein
MESDPVRTAQRCLTQAQALVQRGHYQAARELLEGILNQRQAPEGGVEEIGVQRALLKACVYLHDFKSALLYGKRALKAAQLSQDPPLIAAIHNELAVVYGRLALYSQALEHLLASLKGTPETAERWVPLNNIGQLYLEQKRLREAQRSLAKAFTIATQHQLPRALGIVTGNLGRVCYLFGDLEGARAHFETSIAHFEALADATYLAPALTRLAELLAEQGEVSQALTLLERSLALHQEAEAFIEETLLTLGRIHLKQRNFEAAEPVLLRARALTEAAELLGEAASANLLLSELYEAQGDYPAALACSKRHHALREQALMKANDERLQALMIAHEVTLLEQERNLANAQREALAQTNRELHKLNTELERLSQEDGLTGLYNRRYLNASLNREVAIAAQHRLPISLILCDIDYFKMVNDTFSHALGDAVLRQVAGLLTRHTRSTDIVARYGGEEFAVLLPGTGQQQAKAIAEKLRRLIADYDWPAVAPGLSITLSFGVAALEPGGTSDALLIAADRALYAAKSAGRNTVCC